MLIDTILIIFYAVVYIRTGDRPILSADICLLNIGRYANSNFTMIRDARYYRPIFDLLNIGLYANSNFTMIRDAR